MMCIFDYNLIASCLAAVFFSTSSWAKSEPFTFAFDCNKQTKLCAFDRLPKGQFGWLLDPEGTCRVVASEHFLFMNEDESFPATRLIEKSKCPLFSGPSLLYLKPDYKDSEYFKLSPVDDAKVKSNLLRLMKSENMVKKAVSDKEKSGPIVPSAVTSQLEKSTPRLLQIKDPLWKNVQFLSLINPNTEKGLLVAIIGENTTYLTGGCGLPDSTEYFRINTEAYIRVQNFWCDSDDGEEMIYQLKDQKFELVHANDVLPSLED